MRRQGVEESDDQCTSLQGALLRRARLQGARFSRALMRGANLSGAQLQLALLNGARLQGADLMALVFSVAALTTARLEGASLTRAELQGASMFSTDLAGANLSEAMSGVPRARSAHSPDGFKERHHLQELRKCSDELFEYAKFWSAIRQAIGSSRSRRHDLVVHGRASKRIEAQGAREIDDAF